MKFQPITTTRLLAMVVLFGAGAAWAQSGDLPKKNAPPVLSADSACAKFYPPNFTLKSAKTADAIAPMARPDRGVAVTDPVYQTCVVRAADHNADGLSRMARNDYARRQAFNVDNSKYLISAGDGFWYTYDAKTYQKLQKLSGVAGDSEMQWSPTDPNIIYHTGMMGMTLQFFELNVVTNISSVVADFGSRLKARWPTANAAWTRSEGSPSANGRYWCHG
jgi:hypothetical protein